MKLPTISRILERLKFYTVLTISFSIFGVFCLIFAIFFPLFYFSARIFNLDLQAFAQKICRTTFKIVLRYLSFIGFLEVIYRDSVPGDYAPILVSNHISMFDIISIIAYFPGCVTFVKSKYFNNLFLWPMISACGYIPLNEKTNESKNKAFLKALAVLEQGGQLVIFPEGTRSTTGKLGMFQNGVFKLAIMTQKNITPIVLRSDRAVFNRQLPKQWKAKTKYEVHILPQIDVGNYCSSAKGVNEFSESVRSIYLEKLPA